MMRVIEAKATALRFTAILPLGKPQDEVLGTVLQTQHTGYVEEFKRFSFVSLFTVQIAFGFHQNSLLAPIVQRSSINYTD